MIRIFVLAWLTGKIMPVPLPQSFANYIVERWIQRPYLKFILR
ncbi:hypothetical protein N422_05020 [Lacticaseibacillus paracasei]|nr:hypothetical protein N422_05020 [Lacticaseibacillus paracasei]